MPRVFKPTYPKPLPADAQIVVHDGRPHARYRNRKGKLALAPLTEDGQAILLESRKWYVEYRDAADVLRKVPGYTDKQATEQLATELERRAAREAVGMTDPFEVHRKRLLADHLGDFERALLAKGNTAGYVKLTIGRISALLTGCLFQRTGDLSAARVAEWLADRRKDGMSVQTSNFYLSAVKGFCRWLVRDRRLSDSPLTHLQGGNVKLDRRHDRRELTASELRGVLEAAQSSAAVFRGLTGPDRFALYATACGTGFRASELASLTPESFDLAATPPTATVAAGYTKNKKTVVQPLPSDLAQVLRGYLAGKPAGQPVWPGSWARGRQAATMLRIDLAAAGVRMLLMVPTAPCTRTSTPCGTPTSACWTGAGFPCVRCRRWPGTVRPS
jgi:integrase